MKASPDPDALVPQQRTYRSLKPSSLSNQFLNNYQAAIYFAIVRTIQMSTAIA